MFAHAAVVICLSLVFGPGAAAKSADSAGQIVLNVSERFAGQIATIDDPANKGALLIAADGITIELDDYELRSTETDMSAMEGIGVYAKGRKDITIKGGTIAGYKWGIFIEDCENVTIDGVKVESSRMQHNVSTPEKYDTADWLDIWSVEGFEQYGGAVYLKNCKNSTVRNVTAEFQQNGVQLANCRNVTVEKCGLSFNSGWGIHLWNSDNCKIRQNIAEFCQRLEFWQYSAGGDSAGILIQQDSNYNVIEDNSFAHGGDGFFITGQRPYLKPSNFNIVRRNDCRFSPHNGIEATFSRGNKFIDNDCSGSRYGFWLGYSYETIVDGNTIEGCIEDAIAIEHGHKNIITNNRIGFGKVGVRLFSREMPPEIGDDPSQDYEVSGNEFYKMKYGVIVSETARAAITGNKFKRCKIPVYVDDKSSEIVQNGNKIG
ncbi:MAG: right-handed parallel beta-helix repeat-containing protein [bacterium]|jgi:parallel beta-helix repeat protein